MFIPDCEADHALPATPNKPQGFPVGDLLSSSRGSFYFSAPADNPRSNSLCRQR
jgi:hypothetical protein